MEEHDSRHHGSPPSTEHEPEEQEPFEQTSAQVPPVHPVGEPFSVCVKQMPEAHWASLAQAAPTAARVPGADVHCPSSPQVNSDPHEKPSFWQLGRQALKAESQT